MGEIPYFTTEAMRPPRGEDCPAEDSASARGVQSTLQAAATHLKDKGTPEALQLAEGIESTQAHLAEAEGDK